MPRRREMTLRPPRRGGTLAGMSLVEIKAEIPAEHADTTDDTLLEFGVENWSLLQDVIARRAWIVGVFTTEAEARARWEELRPLLAHTRVDDVVIRPLADQDWRDSYKAHFQPSRFGRLHWVPIWLRDEYVLPAGDVVIWLDPGRAFGTGNHETTRLCCERLVSFAETWTRAGRDLRTAIVVDAGCGSGILALSAAKLGVGDVSGFDNDPEAVRVSLENAALNGLAGKVPFATDDLVGGLVGRTADLVLANIQADVLMRFIRELTGAVAPGGSLVLSGILAAELPTVQAAFAAAVPEWAVDSRTMGEWSDVLFVRP
ncbi:MAG TPA: 50S ribosomal protein L11 methyltransferase [Opitutaceae bacterium]